MSSAVSNSGMARNIVQKISWKIAFPAIILLATIALLHLDQVWLEKTRRMDDMPITSAWGLICFLNWPALFLTFWLRWVPDVPILGVYSLYDCERLVASLAFWACLGWILDRRLAGLATPIITSKPIRIGSYILGFSVALYAMFAGASASAWWLLHLLWFMKSRWIYLMGRELNSFAAAVWGLVGTIYFCNKLFGAKFRRRRKQPASNTSVCA
jgi:hypothetical protein